MATGTSYSEELTDEMIDAVRAQLPDEDGENLESAWHRAAINLLIDVVHWLFQGRTDYYVGGNMFIHFSRQRADRRSFRGPDFFLVKDVDGSYQRRFWWVFDEDGRFPNVIIELLAPTTAREDRTTKKDVYEQTFHTPEYFCYDPETQQLEGWRLANGHYHPIGADDRGWLWCEQLGVWLGTWAGTYQIYGGVYPRFYGADGQLLLTKTEATQRRADAEQQRADVEQQRANAEHQRADAERQRAEAEQQRADAERRRADAERQRAAAAARAAEVERQRTHALQAELAPCRRCSPTRTCPSRRNSLSLSGEYIP